MKTNEPRRYQEKLTLFIQGISQSLKLNCCLLYFFFWVSFLGGYGHASITFITFNWVFLYSQRMSYKTMWLTHVQIVIVLMCVYVCVYVGVYFACVCVCAPVSVTAQTNASFSYICCCCWSEIFMLSIFLIAS